MHAAVTLLSDLNPFWDQNILTLIEGIRQSLPDQALITVAKEIAAVFALIYLSVKAYTMILGEGRFEVMPLFRPFIIALTIINFNLVTEIVGYPGQAAGDLGKTSFEANATIMNHDMDTKKRLTDSLFAIIISHTTELKEMYVDAAKGDQSEFVDDLKNVVTLGTREAFYQLSAYVTVYEQLLWMKLSLWLQSFITWIVVGIFKGIAYCLFFLQLILMYILGVLGPVSFAFSIAGPFKDSWVQWVGRYVAVSFYSTIGFIILNIACAIINYGLLQEIDRLSQLLAKSEVTEQFIASISHVDNFVGYLFIALVTALAGIISTPVISSWIIGTVGAGNALFSTYVQTARTGAATAAGVAGKAATAPLGLAKALS